MLRRTFALFVCLAALGLSASAQDATSASQMPSDGRLEYRLLATNRTATMEKEMKEAAEAGYRFEKAISGPTAFGGAEALVIMARPVGGEHKARYEYKLLATSKTSTMQKELQAAADAGFDFIDQTVFASTFGGKEVSVILERNATAQSRPRYEYKLIATSKTSTLQKELQEVGEQGFQALGMTVGQTALGGSELVVITRRPAR